MNFIELCKDTIINTGEIADISLWDAPKEDGEASDDFQSRIVIRYKEDPTQEVEYEIPSAKEARDIYNRIAFELMGELYSQAYGKGSSTSGSTAFGN